MGLRSKKTGSDDDETDPEIKKLRGALAGNERVRLQTISACVFVCVCVCLRVFVCVLSIILYLIFKVQF